METGPLVGAVTSAHRAIAVRLAALEGAARGERSVRLVELTRLVHATADAEESVLFPALLRLVDDNGVLTDACTAEHREAAGRLDAIASSVDAPGFTASVQALARDVRHHMADEENAALPALVEGLDPAASAALADEFQRAIDG